MRTSFKQILACILCLSLATGLTACGSKSEISFGSSDISFRLDETGYVTWTPIEGAVEYECNVVDGAYTNTETLFLTEPGYQLEEGYCLHVRSVFEDGSSGNWYCSDYFGEPVNSGLVHTGTEEEEYADPSLFVDIYYDVTWDSLECFELISAIRPDSMRELEDGLLYFEADGPHGVMRFEGKGVKLEDGLLILEPGARIWGLDAIGRICAFNAVVSEPGAPENHVYLSGGYTFTDETSVESHEELMYVWGLGGRTADAAGEWNNILIDLMEYQPNFVIFGSDKTNADAFSLSAFEVYYDTTTFATGIRYMELDTDFYGLYLTGDRYDADREVYDLDANRLTFYLGAVPDLQNEIKQYDPAVEDCFDYGRAIIAFTPEQFQTGALRYADGTETGRDTPLKPGMTIDVTVGNYTYPVLLPVNTPLRGAQNLNQLNPYAAPVATGDINVLLVPVAWQDQPESASEENLLMLKAEAGRVIENGAVTDYSEKLESSNRFSLSEYFDIASYGALNISTFVTDWFVAPFDYSTYQEEPSDDETFRNAAYEWLMNTYPNIDWTGFDKDGNGYFDALIFINVGTSDSDSYYPWSFAGGTSYQITYNGGLCGTPDKPTINTYINVNANMLDHNTLVHEFGHTLGLIDYYDVTYSGIDAVGGYDMQSSNCGDWNPYSKYAAGWITPEIAALKPGESREYTIGAFSDTGDAIVVPVVQDTFDGPFNEYIMIDLFTDGGVNEYDAAAFGLGGVSGVRIYHIDARMETHSEEANGQSYTFGTPNKSNAYTPGGTYHVELIQAGKDNTFTDPDHLNPTLSQKDLFRSSMTFTLEDYSEFFRDGKMDNGSDFPYTIEIVSANASEAVIRVTAE